MSAELRSRAVRTRFRVGNAWRDLIDRWLRGKCCAAPRYQKDGGYHFWRCGLKRGHKGQHRSLNYLWGHGEGSVYDPDHGISERLDRHPIRTRKQRREFEAWYRAREAKRRPELAI